MKAIVVGGGEVKGREFYRRLISSHDLVIGADGGADSIRRVGLLPNAVVGDFDSVSAGTLAWLKEKNVALRTFPTEKDKTDMELAIDEALALGAGEVTLTGTWGGRFDHTLANVGLLKLLKDRGITGSIREKSGAIYLVAGDLAINGNPGDTVSLLAVEESRGVDLSGFKYRIGGGCLPIGSTLGISNVLLGKQGKIAVQSGLVLVVHPAMEENRKQVMRNDGL